MARDVSRPRGDGVRSGLPGAWLWVLFFVSGACSLVYEVIWARHLTLWVGHSSTAHAIVVSVFMGGLGFGYVRFGRMADRASHPLRLYAALEAGIAVWAFVFPWLYEVALSLVSALGLTALGVGPVGFGLGVLLLGPPTVWMGGTLPVLVRALSARGSGNPGVVASLYGINSLGAVFGALTAGFMAIEYWGLTATLQAAAALNGVLALGAAFLARGETSIVIARAEPPRAQRARPWPGLRLTVAILGFVSMALQALWIRLVALILGSSTYAFAAVVAGFIAGITVGSASARLWLRRRPDLDPMRALGWVTLLAAGVLWWTGTLYEQAPWEMASIRLGLPATDEGFYTWTGLQLLWVVAAVGVVTSLFGLGLPLAAEADARASSEGLAFGTGRVFAWNTAGAVLGAATGAPVWMAWLGLPGAWQAATLLLAVTGVTLWVSRSDMSSRVWWCGPAVAAALVFGIALNPPAWDARVMNAGAFRLRDLKGQDFNRFREGLAKSDLVFHEDGPDASVAVIARDGHKVLMVNGKPDASTRGDMLTQVASAHIPLLLHPDPEHALVIGLGSGVTASSAARHGVDVDVVELSPAVVHAAAVFAEVNGDVLTNPRVHVISEDARAVLGHTERRWDVVISEPSNPWVAGNANLFTRDFFQLVRSRLAPGGVLAQWIHLYESEDAVVALVLRTLGEVFDHVTLWELHPNDLLLVASGEPITPDLQAMSRRIATPSIQQDLVRVDLQGIVGLLSRQVLGSAAVDALADDADTVHTDDHPILEYLAPRGLFKGGRSTRLRSMDQRTSVTSDPTLLLTQWVAEQGLSVHQARDLFVLHTLFPSSPDAYRKSLLAQLGAEAEPSFLVQLVFTLEAVGWWEEARVIIPELLSRAPDDPEALHVAARVRLADLKGQGLPWAEDAEVRTWLARCLTLGDEPRRRCQRLQSQMATAASTR